MTKPEKLTAPILKPKPDALPHAGNPTMPGVSVEAFSVAVDRSRDGAARVTFISGGINTTYVFPNADRQALVEALLDPHPDCARCVMPAESKPD